MSLEGKVGSSSVSDGVAKIKTEFIILDHKSVLVEEFVSEQDKRKCSESCDNEPSKKRLRGQNKHRPAEARLPKKEKLCPIIINNNVCSYGDNCYYSHDVKKFMDTKPKDIGSDCHLYKTFGKCTYGVSCRFCSSHIGDANENIVEEEKWEKCKEKLYSSSNNLSKELQMNLRKRNYDFSLANESLKSIEKLMTKEKKEKQETETVSEEKVACANENTRINDHESHEAKVMNTMFTYGCVTDEDVIKLRSREIKQIEFKNLLYLAPLTTVGNLPFRRVCKQFGADVTCGEMAVALNLLQGQQSEWALVKRHSSENIFGVQLCGAHADVMSRCSQLLMENCSLDFIDINVGCPIDIIYKKGAGSGLMNRPNKFESIVRSVKSVLNLPLTVKIRTGVHENKNLAHLLIPKLKKWGINLVSIHGRSREARYTKFADWSYIAECAKLADPMPLFGNGDVLSYEDYYMKLRETGVHGVMIGRGALLKPWIFTEIKEKRHWDISSGERFDILKDYVNFGFEHWGCDSEGVEKTRRFLLEWLSFLYRYIPVGLLERVPQRINERPPFYRGRNDLETLMASPNCADWIKISEMLLGPVPANFVFLPKHKANSYK